MKYQIQSYQLIYATGERDTVKIPPHEQPKVDDLWMFRKEKKLQYNCMSVNMTYTEVIEKDDNS